MVEATPTHDDDFQQLNDLISLNVNSCSGVMTVGGLFGKVKTNIVIDTGSGVSLVSEQCLRLSGLQTVIRPYTNINISSADGSPLQVMGISTLSFKIGRIDFDGDFFIVKNLKKAAIIGNSWLEKHRASISYERKLIKLDDFYFKINIQQISEVNVCITEFAKVPPRAETVLKGTLETFVPNVAYIVESDFQINNKYDLSIASSIVNTDDGTIPLRICNTSTNAITLFPKSKIAKASPLPIQSSNPASETNVDLNQTFGDIDKQKFLNNNQKEILKSLIKKKCRNFCNK